MEKAMKTKKQVPVRVSTNQATKCKCGGNAMPKQPATPKSR